MWLPYHTCVVTGRHMASGHLGGCLTTHVLSLTDTRLMVPFVGALHMLAGPCVSAVYKGTALRRILSILFFAEVLIR